MSGQNDVEMQYKAPIEMSPEAPGDNLSATQEVCRSFGLRRETNRLADLVKVCRKEQPKRTILGMRGGGIICE